MSEVPGPAEGATLDGRPVETIDRSWQNMTDPVLAMDLEGLTLQVDKSYFLDLSGNRLSLKGLADIVEVLKANQNVSADLSGNSFGFTDAYQTLLQKEATCLISQGRLTIGNRDKTVEAMAARLMVTEENVNKLQVSRSTMKRKRDDSIKHWKGWMDVESSALEEQVSRAVCAHLDKGTVEILAVGYKYVGSKGDLDGLVIGNYKGTPVYVLVEAKHNMDGQRQSAMDELKDSSRYFDKRLLHLEPDMEDVGDEEREQWEVDRDSLQVNLLRDRQRYWAFGGQRYREPEKLNQRGKRCFIVQPNHEGRFEVSTVE